MHSYQTSRYQILQKLLSNQFTHPTPDTSVEAISFKKFIMRRMLVNNIAVFFIQLIGVMMHLTISSPIWFDTGTACAYLFMRGYRVLPGIFFAYFAAYFWLQPNISFALLAAILLTFQPFFILWFTHRFISPSLLFYRTSILCKFVAFISLLSVTVTATLLCVYAPFMPADIVLYQEWFAWTLANINGILIIASALTVWDAYFPQVQQLNTLKKWPIACLYTLVIIVMINVMCGNLIISLLFSIPLIYSISKYAGKCASLTGITITGLLLGLLMFLGMSVPSQFPLEIFLFANILMAMYFTL